MSYTVDSNTIFIYGFTETYYKNRASVMALMRRIADNRPDPNKKVHICTLAKPEGGNCVAELVIDFSSLFEDSLWVSLVYPQTFPHPYLGYGFTHHTHFKLPVDTWDECINWIMDQGALWYCIQYPDSPSSPHWGKRAKDFNNVKRFLFPLGD
jgi:hypothetical protein